MDITHSCEAFSTRGRPAHPKDTHAALPQPNTPNGYHGYWQRCVVTEDAAPQNCSMVNPHFGSAADLAAMTSAGAAADFAFMLDVVGNHMGGVISDTPSFYPFNSSASFHDCTGCPGNCQIQDYNNQAQVQHCRLAGLPDLNQTQSFVANTLQEWVHAAISRFGFQGLRVDTTPEVNKPFWRAYEGASGVFAVGEVFNGDVGYVSSFQGSALTSVLSYPMYFTLRAVFGQQQSMNQLQAMVQAYEGAFSDTSVLGTFVDNHDNPRFLSQQSDWALYTNALLWVLTARGIPIWYYGTEYGFDGADDPANREALWPAGFDISGHPLGVFGQSVNKLRAQRGVAADWAQTQRYSDDSFYAFTRGQGGKDDASAIFVALTNTGSQGGDVTRTITYHPYPDGTRLCNWFATDGSTSWDAPAMLSGVAGAPASRVSVGGSRGAVRGGGTPVKRAMSTLMAAVRAAGQAAGQVGEAQEPARTRARLAAAEAATASVLRQAMLGAASEDVQGVEGEDCVTVQGGAFTITLGLGEPKLYVPQ